MLYMRHGKRRGNEVGVDNLPGASAGMNLKPCSR